MSDRTVTIPPEPIDAAGLAHVRQLLAELDVCRPGLVRGGKLAALGRYVPGLLALVDSLKSEAKLLGDATDILTAATADKPLTQQPAPRRPNLEDGLCVVLLACGHWIQPEVVHAGTRTWLCPFGDLTQPAARDEAGAPAVIDSWDYWDYAVGDEGAGPS